MINKEEIIRLLKEAAFDSNEYWVTSGAAMVLYGIKAMTRDIDLGCTSQMADKLENKGYYAEVLRDGSRRIVFSETIEIFENWIEDKVVLLEGLPVVSMDGMIKMKEKLGREKYLEDIRLINEFRNSSRQPHSGMTKDAKNILWILMVYALSFICYIPMLLRQSGAVIPDALLYLRYFFVLIPALISAIFLLSGHGIKACWIDRFKRVSTKEIFICAVIALTGVLTTCGYSLWQKISLFRNAYPSILSLAAAAVYLFATALAEEMAWRGFLLKRIASGRRKAPAALLAGALWAAWHIPMWTIRNSLGLVEVVPLFIWAVLISLLLGMTYFRFENLLSVSLLHMAFNICFLAPAKYNNIAIFAGIMICYFYGKYKKGIKEF